ncbi:hypothetical protein [Mycolicibacillus trivialis]|uniref:PknH-like extracellular domain-containing protein n=1 Tax=Mycolicibacillus trivialis TaxID=1798 RepID=A0A1X2EIF8_9MYCO|nr:hypothetical protein [Mycolicibacillus trivialis]ORX03146.1 hypothetical protein AWC30_11525 [Mycolicibacillus trivialis]
MKAAHRGSPRILAVAALAVLGICGAIVLVSAAPPPDLVGRSNWVLAGALPPATDFPADWRYSVSGPLGFAVPPEAEPGAWARDPAPVYLPARCGELPGLFTAASDHIAAVRAERPIGALRAARAETLDAAATGELTDPGPVTSFRLWTSADPAGLLAGYRTWLHDCGTYRVAATDPFSGAGQHRQVTTMIAPTPPSAGALAVLRTYTPDDGAAADPLTFAVRYYPVRGLMLETTTTLTGTDRELIARLADQTAERLAAL